MPTKVCNHVTCKTIVTEEMPGMLVTKKGKFYCPIHAPAIQRLIDISAAKRASAAEQEEQPEAREEAPEGFDPNTQIAKAAEAQNKLTALYAERNAIREHYYKQKQVLRENKRSMNSIDYNDALNALKRAYGEQLDRVFDGIRACKVMIEATEQMLDMDQYSEAMEEETELLSDTELLTRLEE